MIVKCKTVVKTKNNIKAKALVFKKSLSFMGEVDMMTGKIIAKGNEHEGENIAGKILIYPEAKGSSGGCLVLRSLASHNKKPSAIINIKSIDYNLVEGAILADIALLTKPDKDLMKIVKSGDILEINPNKGTVAVELKI